MSLKISPEIKKNRCVTLDKEYFGRPVKLTVLYSPSGMANAGISRSSLFLQVKAKYKDSKTPVKDFKVDYYRKQFGQLST